MGKRKVFKGGREPQYYVITKWEPEAIDGVGLKLRDLYVTYDIMLDYTNRFVRTIEAEHPREEQRLDFNAPITESARRYQDLIRVMFSAHLSTYSTILYYLNDQLDDAGKKWLADLREADPAMAAFDRLRNRDIHNEPMHVLLGMRFRISKADPPYSSLETKEVHLHHALLHEGVGFYPPPLSQTAEFTKHPGLVEFLTFESLLQLAHTVIHRVSDLLDEAMTLQYWSGTGTQYTCRVCQEAELKRERAGDANQSDDRLIPLPLDDELLEVLKEVCKSYQSFIRALVKSLAEQSSKSTPVEWADHVLRYWLLYLLLVSYDVGFMTLATLREGLDRHLVSLKRQAFEYAAKAQYLVQFPGKAEEQYRSLPLKLRDILDRLSAQDANFAKHEVRSTLEEALRRLPSDAGPRYGDVSMLDMLKKLYPKDYQSFYINNYMIPSAIMHGSPLGFLDALRRLDNGKLWLSHFSLTTTRTQNVLVITDSLLRVLLITGDRFNLRGAHWVKLVETTNGIMERLKPGTQTLDIPVDGPRFYQAVQYKKSEKNERDTKG